MSRDACNTAPVIDTPAFVGAAPSPAVSPSVLLLTTVVLVGLVIGPPGGRLI